MNRFTVVQADVLDFLRSLPDGVVQCCVTSPPYWGLRDYGVEGQIGLEPTPEAYVANMAAVFREVRRVLREDGCLWLNLGDSYNTNSGGNWGMQHREGRQYTEQATAPYKGLKTDSLKPKDLIGIPWRVAFALQADGWYLRQDIIWHKPAPMPESVTDRCTKSHEYVFLLTKSERYYYDADAIAERAVSKGGGASFGKQGHDANGTGAQSRTYDRPEYEYRNCRSVWTIPTKSYHGAHFAVMPPELAKRCILAGCPRDGLVLDPFGGSGTTIAVAVEHGRRGLTCELNPDYIHLIHERLASVTPNLV